MPHIENFALIIGAMKAGTTSLFEYLGTHPQIAPCRLKEPNFFNKASRWEKGPEFYFRQWRGFDPARHRYALEATVAYAKMPRYKDTASRIRDFDASFRFIYILRDPIDRIESHIAHNIAAGRVPADDYESMLEHALNTSRYAFQLDAFRRRLGNPEVLLLDFSEFLAAPQALLRRCTEFLGIEPFAFAPRPPANTRRAIHGSESFRLSDEERQTLQAALRDDVLRLRDRYGFDITGWNFASRPGIFARSEEAYLSVGRRHAFPHQESSLPPQLNRLADHLP